MEPDAAPAGGDERTPAPGRPGDPIGGHYDPSARSSLDWDWRKRLVPGNADPGTEIAAEARREAPAHRKMCGTTEEGSAAWCASPSR